MLSTTLLSTTVIGPTLNNNDEVTCSWLHLQAIGEQEMLGLVSPLPQMFLLPNVDIVFQKWVSCPSGHNLALRAPN